MASALRPLPHNSRSTVTEQSARSEQTLWRRVEVRLRIDRKHKSTHSAQPCGALLLSTAPTRNPTLRLYAIPAPEVEASGHPVWSLRRCGAVFFPFCAIFHNQRRSCELRLDLRGQWLIPFTL